MLLRTSFILTILQIENIFKIYFITAVMKYFSFLQRGKIIYLVLPHAVLFTFPFETGT